MCFGQFSLRCPIRLHRRFRDSFENFCIDRDWLGAQVPAGLH